MLPLWFHLFCSRNPVSVKPPFMQEWSRTSPAVTSMWCRWTKGGSTVAVFRMASPQKGNVFAECGTGSGRALTPCLRKNIFLFLCSSLFQHIKPHRRKSLQSFCRHLKKKKKSPKDKMPTNICNKPTHYEVKPTIMLPKVNKSTLLTEIRFKCFFFLKIYFYMKSSVNYCSGNYTLYVL